MVDFGPAGSAVGDRFADPALTNCRRQRKLDAYALHLNQNSLPRMNLYGGSSTERGRTAERNGGSQLDGEHIMLVRVRVGPFDTKLSPSNGFIEPKGRELWSGEINDLTVTALHDAKIPVEPGEWYSFADFTSLIESADADENGVYSTVTTSHLGAGKPWVSTIEVSEMSAALMMCGAVVKHVQDMGTVDDVWVRVE